MIHPAASLNTEPTIVLGGEAFPIPALAFKQNRKIQPLLARVAPKIIDNGARIIDLTDQDVDDLLNIALIALSRAHPDVKPDSLDDMPVTVSELTMALLVVAQQTGLFGGQSKTAGEAPGEPNPPTGTV